MRMCICICAFVHACAHACDGKGVSLSTALPIGVLVGSLSITMYTTDLLDDVARMYGAHGGRCNLKSASFYDSAIAANESMLNILFCIIAAVRYTLATFSVESLEKELHQAITHASTHMHAHTNTCTCGGWWAAAGR